MKIDLMSELSLARRFPPGSNIRIRLLNDVCDPVTQNVLHRRDEILYMEDIAQLHDVHSIDYIDATFLTNHSDR